MAKRVLGVAYWTLGQPKLALENLTDAQKVYEGNRDDEGAANCLMNTGMVYADIGDYDKAIAIYESFHREIYEAGLKVPYRYDLYENWYCTLKERPVFIDAKEYLTNALNMHSEDNFTYGMAEAHNWIGRLSISSGR